MSELDMHQSLQGDARTVRNPGSDQRFNEDESVHLSDTVSTRG